MDWLTGNADTVGFVALSALLIYAGAVLGLRASHHRTLAEMGPADFVVAVSVGTIVGRTATTEDPSFVQSIAALVTLLVVHRLLDQLGNRSRLVRAIISRSPAVVVRRGEPQLDGMRKAGISMGHLRAMLRVHGEWRLEDVELGVMESNGKFSVLRTSERPTTDPLADEVLRDERR